MNNKKVIYFYIFSTIFSLLLGTLLHFTYNWSNNNIFIGSFSAVNESTWEHLKLIFFPLLITTLIGYFYIGKDYSNFLSSQTIGIIISILFIIIFFYTYTGVFGINLSFINILSFIIAIILGNFISYKLLGSFFTLNKKTILTILIILFLSFIIFTYAPPKINLFKDPLSKTYGIQNKNF